MNASAQEGDEMEAGKSMYRPVWRTRYSGAFGSNTFPAVLYEPVLWFDSSRFYAGTRSCLLFSRLVPESLETMSLEGHPVVISMPSPGAVRLEASGQSTSRVGIASKP